MLAYDYPLLGLFWTILIVFIWVAWLILLFRILIDLFRNDETSGWVKAIWALVLILLPYLGVFVYLIVYGSGMYRRSAEQATQQREAFEAYVRETAGTGASPAEELSKLAALRDQGAITEDEFAQQKAKLLA